MGLSFMESPSYLFTSESVTEGTPINCATRYLTQSWTPFWRRTPMPVSPAR